MRSDPPSLRRFAPSRFVRVVNNTVRARGSSKETPPASTPSSIRDLTAGAVTLLRRHLPVALLGIHLPVALLRGRLVVAVRRRHLTVALLPVAAIVLVVVTAVAVSAPAAVALLAEDVLADVLLEG